MEVNMGVIMEVVMEVVMGVIMEVVMGVIMEVVMGVIMEVVMGVIMEVVMGIQDMMEVTVIIHMKTMKVGLILFIFLRDLMLWQHFSICMAKCLTLSQMTMDFFPFYVYMFFFPVSPRRFYRICSTAVSYKK
jgi:hypothetical protein